ncbi:sodium-independent anion transporter, partial [Burkholderia sp. SIMBA_019]|uniref:sodium-independent anion transporter n=1 Tax=Burkholderia sp. SIMBA_019 TaxID=3085765 RepID=UPI00397BF4B6
MKLVILDLSNSPVVDIAGARMLATLHTDLDRLGKRLRVVAAHGSARDMLRAEALTELVGDISRRVLVDDAIEAYLH